MVPRPDLAAGAQVDRDHVVPRLGDPHAGVGVDQHAVRDHRGALGAEVALDETPRPLVPKRPQVPDRLPVDLRERSEPLIGKTAAVGEPVAAGVRREQHRVGDRPDRDQARVAGTRIHDEGGGRKGQRREGADQGFSHPAKITRSLG